MQNKEVSDRCRIIYDYMYYTSVSHHIEIDPFPEQSKVRRVRSHRIALKESPTYLYVKDNVLHYRCTTHDLFIYYDCPNAPDVPGLTYNELIEILDDVIQRATFRLYVEK